MISNRNQLTTNETLKIISWAGLLTVIISVVPYVDWLNYPFRLLLTIVHELSHGLTAILTGGDFINFVIYPNGAGLAYTRGGLRFLVIPAGYLGVALFGATLIMLGRNPKWGRIAISVIGGAMMLFSLRYGIPTIFSSDMLYGILTTVSGFTFGAIFMGVALKSGPSGIIFWIHFVAIQTVLTAFSDLTTLIGLSAPLTNAPATDAQSMADLTFIPAIVWAGLWAIMALLMISGAIWLTWVRPLLAERGSNRLSFKLKS